MVKIKDIIDFISLPDSTKCLYFYLSESTDEYDYVEEPERIAKSIKVSANALEDLIKNRFLIVCENGVIVVKNYKLRNCLPDEEAKPYITEEDTAKPTKKVTQKADIDSVIEEWNKLQEVGIAPIRDIKPSSKRFQLLKGRIREYSIESVLEAIKNVKDSDFLCGNNNNGWMITFDWFIRPNNFVKVLEGNYSKKEKQHGGMARTVKREAKPLIPYGKWSGSGNAETPFV